jgi:hypothetical protein
VPGYTAAVPSPKRTDRETLDRLLASGTLTLAEAVDVERIHEVVATGRELDPAQRLKANALYERHKLDGEGAQSSRRLARSRSDALNAKFDAMPRPKKPPGK